MASRDSKPKKTSETYEQYVQSLYKWEKEIKEQETILSKDESLTTSVGYKKIQPSV